MTDPYELEIQHVILPQKMNLFPEINSTIIYQQYQYNLEDITAKILLY